jgi:hypothetical protein
LTFEVALPYKDHVVRSLLLLLLWLPVLERTGDFLLQLTLLRRQ